jgi:peptidoglycan/LPS O-acetylase OafA/YrhL
VADKRKQVAGDSKRSKRVTLDARLTAASNRPSGFDYMRLVLATLVVCSHTIDVCYGTEFTYSVWRGPARPFFAIILPMFFALSGFLVAGSFERCKTIVSFGGLRVLRLMPALAVDTVLGALLLGPIFTALPLADYFSQPGFLKYFLNITGIIHYFLPGVFANNPWPNYVNQQLWTLPFEMICYAGLVALSFLGIAQRPSLFLISAVVANVLIFVANKIVFKTPHSFMFLGSLLVQCFLFGIAAHLFRRKIIWSKALFFVSAAATFACLAIPGFDYLAPLPATYVTVYLGLLQPKRNRLIMSGDYSYGIFLYGFPVQQAVVAALGHGGQYWYTNMLVSLPVTFALAVLSWWCVEKPALRLKPLLLKFEGAAIRRAQTVPGMRFFIPALSVRDAGASKATS